MKKQLHIEKTEINSTWVQENLTTADYKILAGIIVVFYNHDFQKTEILNAINK